MSQLCGTLCEKSFIVALAALAATASFAQSSVTISGGLVLAVGSAKVGTTESGTQIRRQTGNIQFAGTEDLGGGLKAGFTVQTTIGQFPDTAVPSTATATSIGDRGASLALSGGFGAASVGRVATSTRADMGIADVSGLAIVNGLSAGSSAAPSSTTNPTMYQTTGGTNSARVIYGDAYTNVIGYQTPTVGGFTAMVATVPTEGNTATTGDGYVVRVGYANGPLNAAFNQAKSKKSSAAEEYTLNTLVANYDFGMAKVGFVNQTGSSTEGSLPSAYALTVGVPVGAGQIGAGIGKRDTSSNANAAVGGGDVKQQFVGYRYNLSKRTNVQVNYNKIDRTGTAADIKETHLVLGHTF